MTMYISRTPSCTRWIYQRDIFIYMCNKVIHIYRGANVIQSFLGFLSFQYFHGLNLIIYIHWNMSAFDFGGFQQYMLANTMGLYASMEIYGHREYTYIYIKNSISRFHIPYRCKVGRHDSALLIPVVFLLTTTPWIRKE